MTNERKNHAIAWQYFVEIGKIPSDARKNEYCLHHKCPALQYINKKRYDEWNIEDLIPMTKSEHSKLHMSGENHPMYGRHHSDETKQKMSEAISGENHPNYGKHFSDETKLKMSEAHKGQTSWNKGNTTTEEIRIKMSKSMKGKHKGKHWYNNGKINAFEYECPEGFVKGRLRKSA